jgi:hypothetical protein
VLTAMHGMTALGALKGSQLPKQMVLDVDSCNVTIRGLEAKIAPKNFALLLYLARRKEAGRGPLHRPSKAGDSELTEALSTIYRDLPRARDEDIFSRNITGEDLGQMISHLNRSIKEIIGDEDQAVFYEVMSEGKKKGKISYELFCHVDIAK